MDFLGKKNKDHTFYRPFIMGTQGGVSSNNAYATKAALDVLKRGGNAVDASAAASLMLGLVEPYHSGIGGGCFTVYYDAASNNTVALDARGTAPRAAYQDMFLQDGQVNTEWTDFGGKSVAVPGLYRAIEKMLKDYGTMTLAELSQPVIQLAREGFFVGFVYERAMDSHLCDYNIAHSDEFKKTYLNNGRKYRFGERLINNDLADTMEAVAKYGVDYFYNGDIADIVADAVRERDGVLSKQDLTGYQVKTRPLVKGNFKEYELVSIGPPSSGGAHIVQMLNILECFDLKGMGYGSAKGTHIIAEAMKIAFADRSVAMGDPDFVKVDLETVLSKEYAKKRADEIDMNTAKAYSPSPGIEAKEYEGNTTHFVIIDKNGNMVSQTQTVRSWWGSGVMAKGKGFVLNNAMGDFSPKIGVKTTQGLAYGAANAVRGGKTPLSSMAPVLIFKHGKPVMSVGAAGGPRIITGTLQAIFNVLEYGMMMDEAVKSPYISCLTHAQGLELEPGFSPDTIALLKQKGHNIVETESGFMLKTMVNGVMVQDGFYYPCGTIRIDGCGGVLLKDGNIALDGMVFD